jgi:hypothetical protein
MIRQLKDEKDVEQIFKQYNKKKQDIINNPLTDKQHGKTKILNFSEIIIDKKIYSSKFQNVINLFEHIKKSTDNSNIDEALKSIFLCKNIIDHVISNISNFEFMYDYENINKYINDVNNLIYHLRSNFCNLNDNLNYHIVIFWHYITKIKHFLDTIQKNDYYTKKKIINKVTRLFSAQTLDINRGFEMPKIQNTILDKRKSYNNTDFNEYINTFKISYDRIKIIDSCAKIHIEYNKEDLQNKLYVYFNSKHFNDKNFVEKIDKLCSLKKISYANISTLILYPIHINNIPIHDTDFNDNNFLNILKILYSLLSKNKIKKYFINKIKHTASNANIKNYNNEISIKFDDMILQFANYENYINEIIDETNKNSNENITFMKKLYSNREINDEIHKIIEELQNQSKSFVNKDVIIKEFIKIIDDILTKKNIIGDINGNIRKNLDNISKYNSMPDIINLIEDQLKYITQNTISDLNNFKTEIAEKINNFNDVDENNIVNKIYNLLFYIASHKINITDEFKISYDTIFSVDDDILKEIQRINVSNSFIHVEKVKEKYGESIDLLIKKISDNIIYDCECKNFEYYRNETFKKIIDIFNITFILIDNNQYVRITHEINFVQVFEQDIIKYINDINNMVDTYDYDTISKYIEEIDHIKIIIGNFDFNIFNAKIESCIKKIIKNIKKINYDFVIFDINPNKIYNFDTINKLYLDLKCIFCLIKCVLDILVLGLNNIQHDFGYINIVSIYELIKDLYESINLLIGCNQNITNYIKLLLVEYKDDNKKKCDTLLDMCCKLNKTINSYITKNDTLKQLIINEHEFNVEHQNKDTYTTYDTLVTHRSFISKLFDSQQPVEVINDHLLSITQSLNEYLKKLQDVNTSELEYKDLEMKINLNQLKKEYYELRDLIETFKRLTLKKDIHKIIANSINRTLEQMMAAIKECGLAKIEKHIHYLIQEKLKPYLKKIDEHCLQIEEQNDDSSSVKTKQKKLNEIIDHYDDSLIEKQTSINLFINKTNKMMLNIKQLHLQLNDKQLYLNNVNNVINEMIKLLNFDIEMSTQELNSNISNSNVKLGGDNYNNCGDKDNSKVNIDDINNSHNLPTLLSLTPTLQNTKLSNSQLLNHIKQQDAQIYKQIEHINIINNLISMYKILESNKKIYKLPSEQTILNINKSMDFIMKHIELTIEIYNKNNYDIDMCIKECEYIYEYIQDVYHLKNFKIIFDIYQNKKKMCIDNKKPYIYEQKKLSAMFIKYALLKDINKLRNKK